MKGKVALIGVICRRVSAPLVPLDQIGGRH